MALTPLHGVGGATAVAVLRAAGFTDIHTVATQFDPDPDFPTVAFPNPEEPGAADALLRLAAEVGADIAIALDPDADRCALGTPAPDGWRMLTGNETGWLLGDYLLSELPADRAAGAVVASSVVSSRMLAGIAQHHGARHVETLTGFKWLARADAGLLGATLVYAYEEAIGYCVDPGAVRDKDGINTAVLACDLVAALRDRGATLTGMLDELNVRHGVHVTDAVTRRLTDPSEAAATMARLRADPRRSWPDSQWPQPICCTATGLSPTRWSSPAAATEAQCGWWCARREPSRSSSAISKWPGRHRATWPAIASWPPVSARRWPTRCAPGSSARSELPVAGVAEPRHDERVVVEPLVEGSCDQPHREA